MNINIIFLAVLIGCFILILSLFTSLTMYRARYFRALDTNQNCNRALKIAKSSLEDSEQERKWLIRQLEDANRALDSGRPKFEPPEPKEPWVSRCSVKEWSKREAFAGKLVDARVSHAITEEEMWKAWDEQDKIERPEEELLLDPRD
jgi:hypothetical protein